MSTSLGGMCTKGIQTGRALITRQLPKILVKIFDAIWFAFVLKQLYLVFKVCVLL